MTSRLFVIWKQWLVCQEFSTCSDHRAVNATTVSQQDQGSNVRQNHSPTPTTSIMRTVQKLTGEERASAGNHESNDAGPWRGPGAISKGYRANHSAAPSSSQVASWPKCGR